jgi:geranylgeranyl pyrophosphate synthase
MKLIPPLELIRSDLESATSVLRDTMAQIEGPLGVEIRQSVNGGKCVRSALVILVGKLFFSLPEPFYKLAAAIEVLHTATLIHDDLVDKANTRRGRETLHTNWPMGVTVLAGDVLLAQTAALVADLARPRILSVFADTLCAMSAGEIKQLMTSGEGLSGREDYYQRIGAKTASLCAAATEMGGILAEADDTQIESLRRFGWELGTAFQIVDDVLDFVGDEARMGKPAGNDLQQGLVTLPVICYLERGGDEALIGDVLAGRRDESSVQAAVEAIRTSGGVEAAVAEARICMERACEALTRLPDNDARQMLLALAEYVVERER